MDLLSSSERDHSTVYFVRHIVWPFWHFGSEGGNIMDPIRSDQLRYESFLVSNLEGDVCLGSTSPLAICVTVREAWWATEGPANACG